VEQVLAKGSEELGMFVSRDLLCAEQLAIIWVTIGNFALFGTKKSLIMTS